MIIFGSDVYVLGPRNQAYVSFRFFFKIPVIFTKQCIFTRKNGGRRERQTWGGGGGGGEMIVRSNHEP